MSRVVSAVSGLARASGRGEGGESTAVVGPMSAKVEKHERSCQVLAARHIRIVAAGMSAGKRRPGMWQDLMLGSDWEGPCCPVKECVLPWAVGSYHDFIGRGHLISHSFPFLF